MNRRVLIALMVSLFASAAPAHATVSAQACQTMVELATDEFNQTWANYSRLNDAELARTLGKGLLHGLSASDREILSLFYKGKVSFGVVDDLLTRRFSSFVLSTPAAHGGNISPGASNDGKGNTLTVGLGEAYSSTSITVVFNGAPADPRLIDDWVDHQVDEWVGRLIAQGSSLPAGSEVTSASAYMREIAHVPAECIPGTNLAPAAP
ncbi:MAG TPA: hypothetical protein VL588_04165, partial [Bdellovibrionota bacterium]|nr:hypothetical protein [Bdellovibrionota bacterium]